MVQVGLVGLVIGETGIYASGWLALPGRALQPDVTRHASGRE